jgi:excisionase family DNA binding protein
MQHSDVSRLAHDFHEKRQLPAPVISNLPSTAAGQSGGVLTVVEVARELRCSKAHVHNLVNGKVQGAQPLPSLRLGRRRLVRRISLEKWIEANEGCYDPVIARH